MMGWIENMMKMEYCVHTRIPYSSPNSVAFFQKKFNEPRGDEASGTGNTDDSTGDWRHATKY